MTDEQDKTTAEVFAAVEDLVSKSAPGDRWELRAAGPRRRRTIAVRHVPSGAMAGVNIPYAWASRSVIKQIITGHGGIIVKHPARRALPFVTAAVFAAWLAWLYLDHVATARLALEVGGGVTLLLAVHELGHVVTLRRFGIRCSPPS